MSRITIAGSLIGSIAETQEVLDFAAEHGIRPEVQVIPVQDVNKAFDEMVANNIRPLRRRQQGPRRGPRERGRAPHVLTWTVRVPWRRWRSCAAKRPPESGLGDRAQADGARGVIGHRFQPALV